MPGGARSVGLPTDDALDGNRNLDLQRIVQMIAALRSVPRVESRPAFVQLLRARLMAEAERLQVLGGVNEDRFSSLPPRCLRNPTVRRLARSHVRGSPSP